MKLGAEPKKVVALGGLLVVAAIVYWMNSAPAGPGYTPPAAARPAEAAGDFGGPGAPQAERNVPSRTRTRATREFRPSVKPRRGEQRPNPSTIDPTLRLDLLAKLQTVTVDGMTRSIFDFGQPPPPKPDPKEVAAAKLAVPSPLVKPEVKPNEAAAAEPAKPAAPPIPLKFYGYISSQAQARKRAFFMEGEDIHVANEGDLVKKRYKIVRIGVNSVVVEDTQFGSQQTLPLEEQQG